MTWALFSRALDIEALSTSRRGLTYTKTRKKVEKNALPPWPISAQDSVISISRVFALPHTKLTPISASSIPHIHAFTCRCRHWSKTSFIYTAQVSHFSLHPARRHRVEMASLGKAPLFSLKGIKEDHYQIFWVKFPFPDSRRRARFSSIKTYQGLLFH